MTGKTRDLQNDKLYCVVADLYSGQMFGTVSGQSFGILSVTPKDAKGNKIPIEKLEDILYIVMDKN